ncbi:MAG TPA: hypothetical protein VFA18_04005, partial [Gemmataceae bacterium]|nr:hypothetical protein [Gemmataceae bacterium]
MTRILRITLLALTCLATTACGRIPWSDRTTPRAMVRPATKPTSPKSTGIGTPLYTDTASAVATPLPEASSPSADPVVIPECQLTVIEKQDVPSRRDGVLLYIGTPLKPGESGPPGQVYTLRIGSKEIKVRHLREGDIVQAGQVIAQLDDSVQQDDLAI